MNVATAPKQRRVIFIFREDKIMSKKGKRQFLENQLEHTLCQMWSPGVKKHERRSDQISSQKTLQTYRREVHGSGKVIYKQFGIRDMEAIDNKHIQWYIDKLRADGKSAPTQHTARAALCKALQKSARDFNVDTRYYTDIKKGRSDVPPVAQNYVEELNVAIGVRRAELMDFLVRDVVERPEGLVLHVLKGKGGKEQYQRILPTRQEYIRKFIRDKSPNEPLIRLEDTRGKENLHALRRVIAKEGLDYYTRRLQLEPGYREQLKREIIDYARQFGKAGRVVKSNDWRLIEKPYTTRPHDGGEPQTFDRLAVLAVSVFHLSHWRCSVTVSNYLVT